MTIHWKAVEQYFTVVLYCGVSQFSSVYNFGKFIIFGLGTVRSERVNTILKACLGIHFEIQPLYTVHCTLETNFLLVFQSYLNKN